MTRSGYLATFVAVVALGGCATLTPTPESPAASEPTGYVAPVEIVPSAPIPPPPEVQPTPPAPLALAGQDGIWLPRDEAARLFSRDQQVGLLERDVASVKVELDLERQKTKALGELVAIERAKADGRAEIAKIETERREAWQARALEAERKIRFNRVAAGAGVGAAAGAAAGPPGMAIGAALGALFGFFFGD